MSVAADTRTYFGDSFEELLPRIQQDLGDDALIVRRREGVVGGIAGFFGRKCVEVEAQRSLDPPLAALPARTVVDAYATSGLPAALDAPEPEPAPTAFVEMLARQTQEISALDESAAVRAELLAAAVPAALVEELVDEARTRLRPFAEPRTPLRPLVREVIERRLRVSEGRRLRRRTIAVLGLAGSGRTTVAASLCHAYAGAGLSVAGLSAEAPKAALRFGALLTDRADIDFELATPDTVGDGRKHLRGRDVAVVDLPPIAGGLDGARLESTLALVRALRPEETHLVLPSDLDPVTGTDLLDALAGERLPLRIVVSHADDREPTGVPVGLALAHRLPFSFVLLGSEAGCLRSADPARLARWVLS